MEKRKFVSLPAACQRLGIPYMHGWHAVVSGLVVAVHENGRWRISEDELETLAYACAKSQAVRHDAA